MDLSALHCLITCNNRPLVEYWWWRLQQGNSLFAIDEARRSPKLCLPSRSGVAASLLLLCVSHQRCLRLPLHQHSTMMSAPPQLCAPSTPPWSASPLPSPRLRVSPVSHQLHLGLLGYGSRPGPSASLLHRFIHVPWFRLRRLVHGFRPALQPRLHPGSSHPRLTMVFVSTYSFSSLSITSSMTTSKAPSLYCWMFSYGTRMRLPGGGTTVINFNILLCFPAFSFSFWSCPS